MPFLNELLVANGTTSLGRIVYSKAVLDMITNDHVVALAVNAGGTGYVVGETFDVVGGTPIGAFVARGIVTAESAGVVTAVKYISAGAYATLPGATGAATTNASAAGNDDLTVDLTTQVAFWILDRDDYVDDQTDFEWICTSTKAVNPATVGLITATSGGNDAVRLMVASGFNNGSTFDAQPDASPASVSFLNVPTTNPELFLSTTERRANLMSRDGNNVQYGCIGLFIPLTNVDASYPFPGMAHAQSRGVRAFTEAWNPDGNGSVNAGVVNPGQRTSVAPPYYYRDNLSTQWLNIAVTATAGAATSQMWPKLQNMANYLFTFAPQVDGNTTTPPDSGQGIFGDNSQGWFEDNDGNLGGIQGVTDYGTGNQMSFVVTAHIIKNRAGDVSVIGYIDGYENVHAIGLTAFEEIESFQSASRYIVFPDTNTSETGQWAAMEII